MSVFHDEAYDRWRYRTVVKLATGEKVRINGTPVINTRKAAEQAERDHIERVQSEAYVRKYAPTAAVLRGPLPTLTEWFDGRYWTEHVLGEKENRESTQVEKKAAYEQHIKPVLGHLPLDEIDLGKVNELRAVLAAKIGRRKTLLSAKTRSNILVVLSSMLNYAEDAGVIESAPRIKIKKSSTPDVERFTFEEYGRFLGGMEREGDVWTIAALLAGDCGLRIGEMLALEHGDIDLVAGVVRVERQERRGRLGPTKGGQAREVPLTPRLVEKLRRLPRIRRGRVLVTEAGDPATESIARVRVTRACRAAELAEHGWHTLRHTMASHAALLGVSGFRLQEWLGHSTFALTQRYVSWASSHRWPVPPDVLAAAGDEVQPDRRITLQLGARLAVAPSRAEVVPNTTGRLANLATVHAISA